MNLRIRRGTRACAEDPGHTQAIDLSIPSSPPPHLRAEMAVAVRRAEELQDQDRELHFEIDGRGRAVIVVRDLDGRVIRPIRPTHVLDVLAGAALEED